MASTAPVDTVPPELSEVEQKQLDAANAERERREQDGQLLSSFTSTSKQLALEESGYTAAARCLPRGLKLSAARAERAARGSGRSSSERGGAPSHGRLGKLCTGAEHRTCAFLELTSTP